MAHLELVLYKTNFLIEGGTGFELELAVGICEWEEVRKSLMVNNGEESKESKPKKLSKE